ncbi:MAG: type IV pili methyl-accepting chemotaxis transducer N-terminal domain-containing protein, partial [Bacteroidota bacterium]
MKDPRFKRLELLYLTALGCIALSIIISQFLIQTSIEDQQDDARVINVAGRQRMLSQKISKLSLELRQENANQQALKNELQTALDLWQTSHFGLLNGDTLQGLNGNNSAKVIEMFQGIEQPFRHILQNATLLLGEQKTDSIANRAISKILENEAAFLAGMDAIVFQYDAEANAKVKKLKRTEYYLFFISLLIILL